MLLKNDHFYYRSFRRITSIKTHTPYCTLIPLIIFSPSYALNLSIFKIPQTNFKFTSKLRLEKILKYHFGIYFLNGNGKRIKNGKNLSTNEIIRNSFVIFKIAN